MSLKVISQFLENVFLWKFSGGGAVDRDSGAVVLMANRSFR